MTAAMTKTKGDEMKVRWILAIQVALFHCAGLASGEERIDVERIKVDIVHPKGAIRVKYKEKVKVKVVVKQPEDLRTPDLVLIVLGNGEVRYSDWTLTKTHGTRGKLEYESEFSMPDIPMECNLVAQVAYVKKPDAGEKKPKIVRVKSEPIKVNEK